MKKGNPDVLKFIDTIRNSFKGANIVYTQGGCFQFYKILKLVYPDAVAHYDDKHVVTEIDGQFYDINGVYTDLKEYDIMDKYDMIDAEDWSYEMIYPTYYHCFDLNEQEMTNFTNYENEKELVKSLFTMYGYRKDIQFGMSAEEICEVLNFSIEITHKKI